MYLLQQIKTGADKEGQHKINWKRDIFGGIVIALVSVPISMGYTQIAGLPVVYGLYSSVLPILLFSFFTTSPQFVVGVDAMPAVMVGSLLASMGYQSESEEALQLAPLMAGVVALWFLLFYFLKAGRMVKYISMPVMSGFITGVGCTIILMQVPKLFGGNGGTGEIVQLLYHIWKERPSFNLPSLLLSAGTILVILLAKKWMPRVPMTVVMLAAGALLQAVFRLDRFGVKLLPAVESGLPKLMLPNPAIFQSHIPDILFQSAGIAAVIMAQTLLASGNYAMKYNDKLDANAELRAYAIMNFASCIVGGCPINGSVSRSGLADGMGCRSQVMSVTAGLSMVLILLFGTEVLNYLPVPVLTGIIVTALLGILDFKMAARLWKSNRREWIIFMVAFLGVLIFGTVNGVLIGVMLSFAEVAIRAVTPPACFVGRIPGQGNFYALERSSSARPIKESIIYRFSGNLFFANIDKFQSDIEAAVKKDTKQVVVDARGIGSVDITAVDRLVAMNRNYRSRGIRFYMTEHDGTLNDQIRKSGGEELVETGALRRTITLALRDAGLEKPYELEGDMVKCPQDILPAPVETEEKLSEFEWLFGTEANLKMESLAEEMAQQMIQQKTDTYGELEKTLEERGVLTGWGRIGLFDENSFLDFLEVRLEELGSTGAVSPETKEELEALIERRRNTGESKLRELNPKALELLREHKSEIEAYIRENHPREYEELLRIQKEARK